MNIMLSLLCYNECKCVMAEICMLHFNTILLQRKYNRMQSTKIVECTHVIHSYCVLRGYSVTLKTASISND
jgi:hypothetical protein